MLHHVTSVARRDVLLEIVELRRWNAMLLHSTEMKVMKIACSSVETKYQVLTSIATELTGVLYVLCNIGIVQPIPTKIFSKNIFILYPITTSIPHAHMKHVKVDYHFIWKKHVKINCHFI